jgi:hypothetical protein
MGCNLVNKFGNKCARMECIGPMKGRACRNASLDPPVVLPVTPGCSQGNSRNPPGCARMAPSHERRRNEGYLVGILSTRRRVGDGHARGDAGAPRADRSSGHPERAGRLRLLIRRRLAGRRLAPQSALGASCPDRGSSRQTGSPSPPKAWLSCQCHPLKIRQERRAAVARCLRWRGSNRICGLRRPGRGGFVGVLIVTQRRARCGVLGGLD